MATCGLLFVCKERSFADDKDLVFFKDSPQIAVKEISSGVLEAKIDIEPEEIVSHFPLDNPSRYVIDLHRSAKTKTVEAGKNSILQRIRLGGQGNQLRIVFDLNKPATATFVAEDQKTIFTISSVDSTSTVAETVTAVPTESPLNTVAPTITDTPTLEPIRIPVASTPEIPTAAASPVPPTKIPTSLPTKPPLSTRTPVPTSAPKNTKGYSLDKSAVIFGAGGDSSQTISIKNLGAVPLVMSVLLTGIDNPGSSQEREILTEEFTVEPLSVFINSGESKEVTVSMRDIGTYSYPAYHLRLVPRTSSGAGAKLDSTIIPITFGANSQTH